MGNYCDRFLKIYLSSYVQVLRQMTQMSDWKCSYVIYLYKSSFLRCETLKSPLPKKKKKKSKTPYNFDGKRKNPFNWISWLSSNKLFFSFFSNPRNGLPVFISYHEISKAALFFKHP